jgi:ubiquinone/menaquinone biosynthesis C-methylase UbiE
MAFALLPQARYIQGMRMENLSVLCCPACKGALQIHVHHQQDDHIEEGELRCACGRNYTIHNRTIQCLYPPTLLPSDAEFQRKYDEMATSYAAAMEWLFTTFVEDQDQVRRHMIDRLALSPGGRVLDVGCGTGEDVLPMVEQVGSTGSVFLLDLSSVMLSHAQRRLATCATPAEYLLGNASYLPFADATFDAVFHFGGLNTFGDKKKALAEMTRVTRVGGKVVVGDEGIAPWLRRHQFGRVLLNANPLYKHTPPLAALPVTARHVTVRWILGGAFYLLDYEVGATPPPLNLDVPMPGKADTLRARYHRTAKRKLPAAE